MTESQIANSLQLHKSGKKVGENKKHEKKTFKIKNNIKIPDKTPQYSITDDVQTHPDLRKHTRGRLEGYGTKHLRVIRGLASRDDTETPTTRLLPPFPV